MNRRQFLYQLVPVKRPNVLIILSDDQGYGDFSAHGNPVLKTPALDALRAASVRFSSFHVAPMCTPTRGQLMSGQDALRNGATSVTAGRAVLRRSLPTLADAFQDSGYATGIFGKWHLGDNYPYRPMERGFGTAMYHLGWGLQSASEFNNDYFDGTFQDNGVAKKFEGYCTDFWFSQAMHWMGEQKKPFFCYLPTNAPHGPAWVDAKYAAPYDKPGLPANFFGMIANLDENMANLEAFLVEKKLHENTVVIFMTDNGATAGFSVHNSGMRGRKTMNFEGGHRVPCWIRGPGLKPADIATPTQIQDLFPTLIDVCGLKRTSNAKFDGVNLLQPIADRMLVVQYGQIPKKWDGATIWNDWRLQGHDELYNLASDPAQKTNIATQYPDVLSKMQAHYERWWAGVEPGLREYQPISIGSPKENPVALTCSDWQDIYCDNATSVRNAIGGPRGGPWNIYIERAGTYEILLSRWPIELQLSLTANVPPMQKRMQLLAPGKALPIAKATLTIAGQTLHQDTQPLDAVATFTVKLPGKERTQMQAWFQDKDGKDLCGAFYAYVRRT